MNSLHLEPEGVVGRSDLYSNVIEDEPISVLFLGDPADGLGRAVGGGREGRRQGGVVAGIEPPAAAVADGTVAALPVVVVPVPRAEGTPVVLGRERVHTHVPGEAFHDQPVVLGLVLHPG